jgi:hypothetical protein
VVKNLELQNKCLLMKFINKLFSDDNPSWKDWVLTATSSNSLTSQSGSYLWNIINDELNTYMSITCVRIKNGAATSFWFDHWHHSGPISSTYAALFSHTTRPNVSVQYIFQHDVEMHLRPRLTTAAAQQLCSLLDSLQGVDLVDGHDVRLLKHTDRPYTTRVADAALDDTGDEDDHHGRLIWRTRVPSKVKVFAWLYFKNRLSTRSNLFSKHIVDNLTCERCSNEDEDRHHVFFGCAESRRIWVSLGIECVCDEDDGGIWSPPLPSAFDIKLWPFVLLDILWRIWETRNGQIFRGEMFNNHAVLGRVRDDLVTWKKRLPQISVPSLMS